ncbi:MAG TPA: carboxypeptidase-like regulatory domain-containing protein [Terracidiphilus sp.]|nr:carboxypeptidase-like regulatory domain-containing protein [Terracidiphilus sp.]
MKLTPIRWAACALLAAGLLAGAPLARHGSSFVAEAQNIGQRTVSGDVVDGASQPVSGATVFLKNQKTKSIRSFTTTAKGRFQFAQVDMTQDFDLWAEKNGKKTAVKTVSSWDARKEFETELHMK